MARMVERLHPKKIANLPPGRYADGNGLYLLVTERQRSWVYRYRWEGKLKEAGLGSARDVGLADARKRAEAARRQVEHGVRPGTRNAATAAAEEAAEAAETPTGPNVLTFGAWCDSYLETMRPGWKNAKHAAQWAMTLGRARDKAGKLTGEGYCLELADKPVAEIGTDDILGAVRPIWSTRPETATRIVSRLRIVLDAAKVAGHRDGPNPAEWRGHLQLLLPKRQKLSRGHHAAMPYKDVPGFMAELRGAAGIGARALELAILCASRSGEVRLATWAEIDRAAACWTVPAERMKGGKEHRVPLTARALEILDEMGKLRPQGDNGSALIFPSGKNTPLSDMTLAAVMKRLKAGEWTPHGFRSSFRDFAGDETSFPREVAEQCLAHVIGGVEGAYRRGDAYAKRRRLLIEWAVYIGAQAPENASQAPQAPSRPARRLRIRRLPLRRLRPAMVAPEAREPEVSASV